MSETAVSNRERGAGTAREIPHRPGGFYTDGADRWRVRTTLPNTVWVSTSARS